MENTIKNKVQFMAQYWGQEVFVNPILSKDPTYNIYVFDYIDAEDLDSEYLVLQSMSNIEDRHVIILARMLGISEEVIKSGLKENFSAKLQAMVNDFNGKMIDYLRANGYALPYLGLSVKKQIDYGWIKLKK